MSNPYLVWGIAGLIVFILAAYYWAYARDKKESTEFAKQDAATKQMRLQSYERLVLLCQRIGLNELVGRVPIGNLPLREAQLQLLNTIKEEYDYNLTQQIYVSPQIWQAVTNLKDQNMYIINQLANTLPMEANGMDLSKTVMNFVMQNENANLQPIVLRAVNNEAKTVLEN
jgi:hypothetical protein